jgi:hypothetical protein
MNFFVVVVGSRSRHVVAVAVCSQLALDTHPPPLPPIPLSSQMAGSCITQCLRTLLSPEVEKGKGKATARSALESQREFVKSLILDLCIAAVRCHVPTEL